MITGQLLANGLIAAGGIAVLAVGFALCYRVGGFFHFSHGIVFAVAPYTALLVQGIFHPPLLVGALLGVACASGSGACIFLLVYKPLRKRQATPLVFLLASMGVYLVLQNLISLCFGDSSQTIRSGPIGKATEILGARITTIQLMTLLTALVLLAGVQVMLSFSKAGLMLRAVANDRELAQSTGIDCERVSLWTFAFGSALAGVAGILVALDVDMSPTMGMDALMKAVVAMIVGGSGSVAGTGLGALVIGLAQSFGVWKIGTQWQDAVVFLVLLLSLLARPEGLLGRRAAR